MTDAPDTIKGLVERFSDNIDSYRSGGYNEAQVRIEFIDPMFKALGWDMDNEAGYAEAYKEVIHEDAIKVGGKLRRRTPRSTAWSMSSTTSRRRRLRLWRGSNEFAVRPLSLSEGV